MGLFKRRDKVSQPTEEDYPAAVQERRQAGIEFIPEAGMCIASKRVLEGVGRVRFMLRVESKRPEDNGWRIFSEFDDDEYLADPQNLEAVPFNEACAIEPALIGIYDFELGSDLEIARDDQGIHIIDAKTGQEIPRENFYVPPDKRA